MSKPIMTVAGTSHYSIYELRELSRGFEPHFEVSLRRYEEFEAGELIPLLSIVISAVAFGFLEAMGEDLWKTLKDRISKSITRPNSEFSDLQLQLKNAERTLTFKCRSKNPRTFESALDKAEAIARSNATIIGTREYVFDQKKGRWNRVEKNRP